MAVDPRLSFLWLEITGKCQLACEPCYAESGPHGTHGTMWRDDWFRVIDEAGEMGPLPVQLIGGEPTLHPDLSALIERAFRRGLAVEVFSNLVSIHASLWETFERCGVRLATSYYAVCADQHDAITGRGGSHDRTLSNVREAVRRGIFIRAGVIGTRPDQDVHGAATELRNLGVSDIRIDVMRRVGRAASGSTVDVSQLCGACASGGLAVTPNGVTYPCVFSRWLPLGSVQERSLARVHALAGSTRAYLADEFRTLQVAGPCPPNDTGCPPAPCPPILRRSTYGRG
jgi:molybdenum cofactor biosynthesis enzyme MoaA